MITMETIEDVKCLPECDERHAEGCPRFEAEKKYYRNYFAVGTPSFWNFRPDNCTCGPDYFDRWCPRHGTEAPESKWK